MIRSITIGRAKIMIFIHYSWLWAHCLLSVKQSWKHMKWWIHQCQLYFYWPKMADLRCRVWILWGLCNECADLVIAAEWHYWEASIGGLPLQPTSLRASYWRHEAAYSSCCIHSLQGDSWDHRGHSRPNNCEFGLGFRVEPTLELTLKRETKKPD